MKRFVSAFIWFVIVGYALSLAFFFVEQRTFLYSHKNGPATPVEAGIGNFFVDFISTNDGLRIPFWHHPAHDGKPTIVFFHDSDQSIDHSAQKLEALAEDGYGVVAMEYRGYANAPGYPSESAILNDAVALVDKLGNENISGGQVVLYGHCFGSAVALQVAARRQVAGLVLESPPFSMASALARVYFWAPVSYLLLDKWMSTDVVAAITSPILVLQGAQDDVTPVVEARTLSNLFKSNTKFIEYPNGHHSDLDQFGTIERIEEFTNYATF